MAVSLKMIQAEIDDLSAILSLQKLAYQSEADLVQNYSIPHLTQTLEGIIADFNAGIILKAVLDCKPKEIVGSVRGRFCEDTLHIGRLIVSPVFQNQGIGAAMLLHMKLLYPHARYELFTSDRSRKNLLLYVKNGYKEFKKELFTDDISFIFLEKKKET